MTAKLDDRVTLTGRVDYLHPTPNNHVRVFVIRLRGLKIGDEELDIDATKVDVLMNQPTDLRITVVKPYEE